MRKERTAFAGILRRKCYEKSSKRVTELPWRCPCVQAVLLRLLIQQIRRQREEKGADAADTEAGEAAEGVMPAVAKRGSEGRSDSYWKSGGWFRL